MCPFLYLNAEINLSLKDIFDKIKKPETHIRLQLSHNVTIQATMDINNKIILKNINCRCVALLKYLSTIYIIIQNTHFLFLVYQGHQYSFDPTLF